MKVKTASGTLTLNKRGIFYKFLKGYQSTGAFDGSLTRFAAWVMAKYLHSQYPSLSWHDAGVITGHIFRRGILYKFLTHKPSEKFLRDLLNELA